MRVLRRLALGVMLMLLASAALLVSDAGRRAPSEGRATRVAMKRAAPSNLALLEFVNVVDVDDAERGIRTGLAEAGLVEGRDFHLTVRNAQGDMPTLSALVDAAVGDRADMLLTLSTPTLQAAIRRGAGLPIVFTFVADAVAAGAGTSNTDHLPNVTGVPTLAAYGSLLALVRECLPRALRLGTLYAPAEVNSEVSKEAMETLAPRYGFELVAVPVNSTADASDATLALLGMGVDVIAQAPSSRSSTSRPAGQARGAAHRRARSACSNTRLRRPAHCQALRALASPSLGLGLGAFGRDFDDCRVASASSSPRAVRPPTCRRMAPTSPTTWWPRGRSSRRYRCSTPWSARARSRTWRASRRRDGRASGALGPGRNGARRRRTPMRSAS